MNAATVTIAGAFDDADKASAAIGALLEAGVGAAAVRVGARRDEGAQELARRHGIRADVDPRDPLAGTPGLATEGEKQAGIDHGAVIGGATGAILGVLLGIGPMGSFIAVAPQFRPFADAVLLFATGVIGGGVLGGAFGPQPSTHRAFRIIDAVEEGGMVVVARVPAAQAEAAQRLMRNAGPVEFLRV